MKAFLKVPPLAFLHLKTLVMIRSSTAVAERSTANTKTIHKEPTYHVFYVLRKVPIYLSYFVLHPLHLNYASSWKQDCLPFSLRTD